MGTLSVSTDPSGATTLWSKSGDQGLVAHNAADRRDKTYGLHPSDCRH